MSNYNPEGFPEGDWDERGDLSWNELDWQQFLGRREKEILRFAELYLEHAHEPDHLDAVARLMGWQADEWSVADFDAEEEPVESGRPASETEEGFDDGLDGDPYTLHRHPVFIVTCALFAQLRALAEAVVCAHPKAPLLTARDAWRLSNALSGTERQVLMALQSLDMGDFMLAVIHFKHAHLALNDCMARFEELGSKAEGMSEFRLESRVRLFDLREVCLRVMSDCREEDRRNFRDNE